MATSKCSSCGSYHFEMVENEPRGSNYKQMFIQCSSCGSVVGVTGFYNTSSLLDELEEKIDKLQHGINEAIYLLNNLQRQ